MSAATVTDAAPPKGKKKLLIIVGGAVLALALAGGGAAVFMVKKKAAAEAEADSENAEEARPARAAAKSDPKATPTFVPLDPFTVNLADRDAERYAQVGMTLEIDDAKLAEQIKTYMPAIRNNILLAIADKTAAELLDREGKVRLALQVRRETSRALGYDVSADAPAREADKPAAGDAKPRRKKAARDPDAALPIRAVHFNNFIVQ